MKLAGCLALSAVLTGGCLTKGRIQEPVQRLGEPIELSALLTVYATSAKSVGYSRHDVLGLPLRFHEQEIEADVQVQVCEPLYWDRSCFASAPGTYRIGVADDDTGAVCSRFLRSIVDYWGEKDEGYLRSYRVLPADKHVFLAGGTYLLYARPETNWEGAFWLFYTLEKLVRIELATYDDSNGFGALDSFVTENLVFHLPKEDFEPSYKSLVPPVELLKWIREGRVTCPSDRSALNEGAPPGDHRATRGDRR